MTQLTQAVSYVTFVRLLDEHVHSFILTITDHNVMVL